MRRLKGITVAGALFVMALMAAQPPAQAQSFDCSKASGCTENVICATPQLGALDSEMASLYYQIRNYLNRRGARELRGSQRNWLASRDSCGCNANCLVGHYRSRIQLFRNVMN